VTLTFQPSLGTWLVPDLVGSFRAAHPGVRFVLLPKRDAELQLLLEFFLLEKCVYEIGYELNNRPEWIEIPLRGLLALLPVRS